MNKPTDHDLDLSVAAMLRFGVNLAAIVVFFGGVLLLRHPRIPAPNFSHFQVGNIELTTLKGIFHGVMQAQPQSIIQLGLVLLIATPVARVVLCVFGFARQRNRLYVAVSFAVLMILTYSLIKSVR